ncbi:thioesterase II family protein [Streptomyces xanthophaeus]|uniref:thioesterase II family protein n=1 Tax=Streptomyces xanthophaeus TaxID=67385 RepID=UPI00264930D7|nr:alpha/beta fold hydrolase [Streptomyces xanthophaeus]WKD32053.1 alpha/beta fold hydrolase [Streptomyces xanthophaeus]
MNSTWFRRFGDAPEGAPRLVLFPHAGGAASTFVPLSRALAGRVDVLAVQYPGRQDRRLESPFESITGHADALAREIRPLTAAPYAFFGHSMGAVLAYETTRRLLATGSPAPCRLFLSGRGAPSPRPGVHDRLDGDDAVIAAVRRLGGTGNAVLDDPELLEMVLPALRADYGALGSYSWAEGAPLPVPVTALIGDADPVVPVARAAAWEEHTTGDFDLRVFPGGHFFLDDHTADIAALLSANLSASGARA